MSDVLEEMPRECWWCGLAPRISASPTPSPPRGAPAVPATAQPCHHDYRRRASRSHCSPYLQGRRPPRQLPHSPSRPRRDAHRFSRRCRTTRAPIAKRSDAVAVRRQERERLEDEGRRVSMRTERCLQASREDRRRSGSRIRRGDGGSTTRMYSLNQDHTGITDTAPDSRWKCRPSTSTGYNRGSTRAASIPPSPSQ